MVLQGFFLDITPSGVCGGGGARKKVQAGYISIVVFSSVQRQEPQRSMQVIQESYRMRVWAQ